MDVEIKPTGSNRSRKTQLDWISIPWYVLLLSAYPTLALLAHNATEVPVTAAFLPFILSVVGAAILLLVFRALLRNWQRAALVVTILLVLFFSYGQVYLLLKGIHISGFYVFRHRTLAPIYLILGGLGIWWAFGNKFKIQNITQILNVIGVVLIVMPVFQIGLVSWRQWKAWQESLATGPASFNGIASSDNQVRPDIYYIILDAYGRSDIIQNLYGYDNSGFLGSLEEMGFFVASCSQSNYAQTELSLASSLNFNYLDSLNPALTSGNTDRSPLWPLIKNSALRKFLTSQGYKTIAFATGYGWTEINNADIYLAPPTGTWELNSFQYLLIQTTAARILLDAQELNLPNTPDDLVRRRTLFALQKIPGIPSIEGPKFVFIHLLVPHSFVFGPNGEPIAVDWNIITPDIFKRGYVDALTFIDKQIETIVPTIIANSPTPPIIIVQGDHGPTGSTHSVRVSNLNTYYLPGHEDMLYPSITPVNTFRVILDAYFAQHLSLLPDISRYSTYQNPYDYSEIQNDCVK
jgi:hypothetical protein